MTEGDRINAEFLFWLEHNPKTYARIVRLARENKAKKQRGSISDIWEDIRKTGVSLRNSFRRPCSDYIMANEPDLEGYFETGPRPSLTRSSAVDGAPTLDLWEDERSVA